MQKNDDIIFINNFQVGGYMKNKLCLLLICVIMLVNLTSCGDKDFTDKNVNVEHYGAKTISTDEVTSSNRSYNTEKEEATFSQVVLASDVVYIAPNGTKYHFSKACAGKNVTETSLEAIQSLRDPCKKCVK